MRSLRARFVLASLLVLSASTLSAQTSRISCKDGTKPKVGHFACWGHGGLIREAVKSAPKAEKVASKPASTVKAASKPEKAPVKKAPVKKAPVKKAPVKKPPVRSHP